MDGSTGTDEQPSLSAALLEKIDKLERGTLLARVAVEEGTEEEQGGEKKKEEKKKEEKKKKQGGGVRRMSGPPAYAVPKYKIVPEEEGFGQERKRFSDKTDILVLTNTGHHRGGLSTQMMEEEMLSSPLGW